MRSLKSNRTSLCVLLVASAFVGMGTSGTIAAAPPADRLQTLINETSAQFQIAYRLHPAEGQNRQQQLNAVLAAWRAAPRTSTTDEQLSLWLRAAIRFSMPGSREALPQVPAFKPAEVVEKRVMNAKPVEPVPAETHRAEEFKIEEFAVERPPAKDAPAAAGDKSDPFRDDPISETK